MLTAEAAGLAVQVVKGVVQLTGRIDGVLAEREAVQSPLALPVPALNLRPGKGRMRAALQDLLKNNPKDNEEDADSLGDDRKKISDEIKKGAQASEDKFWRWTQRYLPDVAVERYVDPNSDFVQALASARPDWAADGSMVVAAFHIGPGRTLDSVGYVRRIALTVVDVLSEFGGENSSLFVRDEKLQGIVGSILQRLGDADVQETESGKELLRVAIGATLNGVLDAREHLSIESDWLDGLLDALAQARIGKSGEVRDDFVVGLLRGEGFGPLVGAMLQTAAGKIADDDKTAFEGLAAEFLTSVGDLVADPENDGLQGFFQNRSSDLLRAGLDAIGKHGPALVDFVLTDPDDPDDTGDPLLGAILKRVVVDLAETPNADLLSTGTLTGIVGSVAAAAAKNPDLIAQKLDEPWLGALIESVAGTVSSNGIEAAFTRDGVDSLFKDVFATFSERPELLVKNNELAGALLGGVLGSLSKSKAFNVRELSTAAVGGALNGIAANPGVLEFNYSELVGSIAGKVGKLVASGKLGGVDGQAAVGILTESLAENPKLFLDAQKELAGGIVDSVVKAADGRAPWLVGGVTLTQVVAELAQTLAKTGQAALANHPAGNVVGELGKVVDAAFARAEKELGHRIGVSSLPATTGMLVEAWANGKLGTIDPDNDNFKKLFAELAEKAA